MMKKPLYLDYAATTPVDPRVAETMARYLTEKGIFGNPASIHAMGLAAKNAIETARAQVAQLIHADPSEIIWTSGATEANNLALKGVAQLYQAKGKHIVTLKTEHPAVLDCCQYLEKNGFFVTYLTPEKNGLVDLTTLEAALRDDTILVSIMHVNNEIGVIQDIAAIANLTAARGIIFHVDAAQSAGKIPIQLNTVPIDLMSFSAHKLYGPKGIGALYMRRKPRVRVAPQLHGGGQEQGMRSGTLATHQIVGMGEAFHIAHQEMFSEQKKMLALRNQLLQGLQHHHTLILNGDAKQTIPSILNLRISDITADALMAQLPEIAFSIGSACLSKGTDLSSVLRALGQTSDDIRRAVRFSWGAIYNERRH